MEFTKDPQAVLDYKWDWSDWLGDGETISSHTVVSVRGITINSSSITDGNTGVIAWLSGGEVGMRYRLVCRIGTNQGRIDDRTLIINCEER